MRLSTGTATSTAVARRSRRARAQPVVDHESDSKIKRITKLLPNQPDGFVGSGLTPAS